MKEYKLVVVGADVQITEQYDNVVKGFAAAEERAKELLNQYLPDYCDAYIACFEKNEETFTDDFFIYTKDCFGDIYWKKMIMGDYVPLYSRLLDEDEKQELEYLRNEEEVHVSDLTEEELKQLRREVCVGSIYLSDYSNSFDIDENEVCNACDDYYIHISSDDDGNRLPETEWQEDTPEEFANFCMNFL